MKHFQRRHFSEKKWVEIALKFSYQKKKKKFAKYTVGNNSVASGVRSFSLIAWDFGPRFHHESDTGR